MLYTFIGILILSVPFLLVFLFDNKTRGFLNVFLGVSMYTIVVAFFAQLFHVFTYGSVVSSYAVLALLSVFYISKQNTEGCKVVCKKALMSVWVWCKENLFIIAGFFIAISFLISLHYFYTGTVGTYLGQATVKNSSYGYPMYSDEWVSASFTQYSIQKSSLPIVSPLNENKPFPNFFVFFHGALAQIVTILSLNPVSQYGVLAIVSGVLTCLMLFLLLRIFEINKFISVISILTTIFITNSGNLPGIWFLLPYNAAFIFLLVTIAGIQLKDKFLIIAGSIVSFLLYSPIIVFIAPVFLGMYISSTQRPSFFSKTFYKKIASTVLKNKYSEKLINRKNGIQILVGSTVAVLVVLALCFLYGRESFFWVYIYLEKLVVRKNLDGGIINFWVWSVMPVFSLPFIVFGFWQLCKKKVWVVTLPILVGAIFWFVYGYTLAVFVIDPSRIVVITSVLLMVPFGFGVQWVYSKIKNLHNLEEGHPVSDITTVRIIKTGVLLFFITFAMFSSKFIMWSNFLLKVDVQTKSKGVSTYTFKPAPPITRFLTEADINAFSGIKEQRFISPSWKGLAIGVATVNYPLDSKSSTISNSILRYGAFNRATCEEKEQMVKKFRVKVFYSEPFNCEGFIEKAKGDRNLILYTYK